MLVTVLTAVDTTIAVVVVITVETEVVASLVAYFSFVLVLLLVSF